MEYLVWYRLGWAMLIIGSLPSLWLNRPKQRVIQPHFEVYLMNLPLLSILLVCLCLVVAIPWLLPPAKSLACYTVAGADCVPLCYLVLEPSASVINGLNG